ncbi:MAG: CCA tRNA nucleotidyltransferase [Planctomycetaceae bacterium]|nr:CCA tRNA nucleotidyltransferase [Planctomycetaceae bacterium]
MPEEQRRFAADIVRRLRVAGFEAYWAGGCVRDQLLGRQPKDYDVATNATPEQIRGLFGHRRTLAIGAAFGVISVRGPKPAGMVEVTTFRRDAAYSDGRHPDSVSFSTAAEDASRRDFTVNGLFYDPVENRVIDFVGGQADLAAKVLRAIGNARDRFAEDKLRMLRAVRFAATLDFAIDADARQAIADMAHEIHVVSPERIAVEMQRMLTDANRAVGVRLLVETSLAAEILPEIVPPEQHATALFGRVLDALARLGEQCGFPLSLAALLSPYANPEQAAAVCQRWRLSNQQRDRVCWLLEHRTALENVPDMRWSQVQPVLVADGIDDLLRLMEATSPATAGAVAHCRRLLNQPTETLDPPPLLTGDDLLAHGIPAGPAYKSFLQRVREAQLDGQVATKQESLALIDTWLSETK